LRSAQAKRWKIPSFGAPCSRREIGCAAHIWTEVQDLSDFVRSRLSFYEILGVSPTAGSDEIARAFARKGSVFRPHAFGVLTELCIAYETLRDPISRREYDATLGIDREPTPLNGSIEAQAGQTTVIEATPPPPASRSIPRQSPHPLAALMTPPAMKPALALGPGVDLHARPEQRIGRGDAPSPSIEDYLGAEARPLDWRRAAITAGAVVIGACLLGGVVGWWSIGDVAESTQGENTVSVSLSPAKALPAFPAPQPTSEPAPTVRYAQPDRPKPSLPERASVERRVTASQAVTVEEQPEPTAVDAGTSHQAVEETPVNSTVAAAMPLPNRVIARTIDRIGYACGGVSSVDPLEAQGNFKVTCTSGQSFQAKPVNGRYRFKRL
jgi:hypothetical protein